MKQLQNDFTSPEQSNRLLELGVPVDSADCYLLRSKHTATFYPHILIGETYTQLDKFLNVLDYLPCWSVGRLIEIFMLCRKTKPYWSFDTEDERLIIDFVVEKLIDTIEEFDFSKLED